MDTNALPEIVKTYLPFAQALVTTLFILIVGWMGSKWASRLVVGAFRNRKLDEALGRFFASIAQYTVLAATVIAALGAVGVETTSLVAVFASAGLAVGLALQGSLANFASGVLILFFRPFNLGDKVTAGGHTGAIDDIGIFATTMVTLDNQTIIIPNSAITGGSIVNHTSRGTVRGTIDVGVAYGADVGQVMAVLENAARRAQHVLDAPAPAVAFVGLGASSLDFKVFAWSTPEAYLDMLHAVRRSVYESLNENHIEIPFNQIVVHGLDEMAKATPATIPPASLPSPAE